MHLSLASSKNIESNVEMEASFQGYGDVCLRIFAQGYKYGLKSGKRSNVDTQEVLRRRFKLPIDGGEESFKTAFTLPNNYVWDAQFSNCGSFPGFCGPPTLPKRVCDNE